MHLGAALEKHSEASAIHLLSRAGKYEHRITVLFGYLIYSLPGVVQGGHSYNRVTFFSQNFFQLCLIKMVPQAIKCPLMQFWCVAMLL